MGVGMLNQMVTVTFLLSDAKVLKPATYDPCEDGAVFPHEGSSNSFLVCLDSSTLRVDCNKGEEFSADAVTPCVASKPLLTVPDHSVSCNHGQYMEVAENPHHYLQFGAVLKGKKRVFVKTCPSDLVFKAANCICKYPSHD
ncbi:hypothetical protein ACOMHN_004975 [Nucella lapillus]